MGQSSLAVGLKRGPLRELAARTVVCMFFCMFFLCFDQ
jgi:hypothetical protein